LAAACTWSSPSERSQAAAAISSSGVRRAEPRVRDPEVSEKVAPAQAEALREMGGPREESVTSMKKLTQPTLIRDGAPM